MFIIGTSVVSLIIRTTLRQSSSAGARIDLSCGLRHPMKLVPLATLVHMDIKAFPSRPSVPLLITNSILEDASVTWIELDNIIS
ncbi:hypothetical protein T06_13014 [Trichinella sp. T6]|nr:hypothetical protein T06_13014 [Trichinella sp. T6]